MDQPKFPFPSIPEINPKLETAIWQKINDKTKPIGALGDLEELACQIALAQNTPIPALDHCSFLLFAGDHGIAQAGVSPYPQDVTRQMLLNFVHGGAAINVFCRQHQIPLQVVDTGVIEAIEHPKILNRRIGPGTKNCLHEPAITPDQLHQALHNGQQLVAALAQQSCQLIGLGEMGIGNSSAASLITARILDRPLEEIVCQGAGCDQAGLEHKRKILNQAIENFPSVIDPYEIMQHFGGFELATALGAIMEAASRRIMILIDGFIMSSVALVAFQLNPKVLPFMIFSHQSASNGHQPILQYLKAKPLLTLNMRLGEGSAAALAYPLVISAVRFLNEMASFTEAQVDQAIISPKD